MGRFQQRMGVLVVRDADHGKPADSDLAVYEALVSECAALDFRLHLCGARSFDYIYGAVRFSKNGKCARCCQDGGDIYVYRHRHIGAVRYIFS